MCCFCFCLHFSDFIALFLKKNKNLLQFTFEKNNLLCKKREKITCHGEKSHSPPPPQISSGPCLKRILWLALEYSN